jgi:hypothetical protein
MVLGGRLSFETMSAGGHPFRFKEKHHLWAPKLKVRPDKGIYATMDTGCELSGDIGAIR